MKSRIFKVVQHLITRRNFRQVGYAGLWRINYSLRPDYPPYPLGASIGITDRCNLKCIMCSRQDPNIEFGELTFNQFQYIIDQIPTLYNVMLTGRGEPLLQKDLFSIIEYLHSKNIAVGLFSNATLLTPEISERLLDLNLEDIRFSVDGATKETFEKIRVGAEFEAVTSNISNFVSINKIKGSKTRIGLRTTAMKDNLYELPAIIHLTSKLGIKELQICNLSELLPHLEGKSLTGTDGSTKETLGNIHQEAMSLAINLRISGFNRFSPGSTHVVCSQPYTGMRIMATGVVNPCCGSMRNFGNVFQTPIRQIWTSSEFINFRKQVRSENPPPDCLSCPVLEWE